MLRVLQDASRLGPLPTLRSFSRPGVASAATDLATSGPSPPPRTMARPDAAPPAPECSRALATGGGRAREWRQFFPPSELLSHKWLLYTEQT